LLWFLTLLLLAGGALTFGPSGQARSPAALLDPPDLPPTPTVEPPPDTVLASVPLAALRFDAAESLAAFQFNEPQANWLITEAGLQQAGFGPAHDYAARDSFALLQADLPADLSLQLTAYNERAAVADVLLRAGADSFYRYRVLADSYAEPAHRLELVQAGTVTLLAEVDAPGLRQYRWHTLSFAVAGDLLLAHFDGREVLRTHDATLSDGQAGFGSLAIGGVRFGSLEVLR
jgi:hypothetical protein